MFDLSYFATDVCGVGLFSVPKSRSTIRKLYSSYAYSIVPTYTNKMKRTNLRISCILDILTKRSFIFHDILGSSVESAVGSAFGIICKYLFAFSSGIGIGFLDVYDFIRNIKTNLT